MDKEKIELKVPPNEIPLSRKTSWQFNELRSFGDTSIRVFSDNRRDWYHLSGETWHLIEEKKEV